MPYHIAKVGSGYFVVDETGKKRNKKPYPSRKAAMPFMRALYHAAGEHKKK